MNAGKQYWRSLEERAQTPEFQEWLHREFPVDASIWEDEVSRRQFLKMMGASLALAGLAGCSMPQDKIVPYVRQPEDIIPGKPLFFATAMPLGGYAMGLLAWSYEGRPTKIEGNPQHPASRGSTDVLAQASVLVLYDPDRAQVVTRAGEISSWSAFFANLSTEMNNQTAKKGAGLRILTETVTSPTLASQIDAILKRFPNARWHQYEPIHRDNVRAGAQRAFGEIVETIYRVDKADVIVSLDGDFLMEGPGRVRYAREFADRRRVRAGQTAMNRLYAVESMPTNTGAMADHRFSARPDEIEAIARELAGAPPTHSWMAPLRRDLQAHRGASLVLAGDQQPPVVHALVHAINHTLGNVGHTVLYTDPVEARPVNQTESLGELVNDLQAGTVELLVVLGGNPAYDAPADVPFAKAMAKAKLRVRLGLYHDETSWLSHWHVPETHFLETWSDARAFDGTVSILQPLIAPLYAGKSAHELLEAMLGKPDRTSHDVVRDHWKKHGLADEKLWEVALHDGVVAGTALPEKKVRLHEIEPAAAKPESASGMGIIFRPDPGVYDGRFANIGWLQEWPRPLTRLTWDNAALISPLTAQRMGLENGDVVELRYRGQTVDAPVWILPGQRDDTVTVHLGYGRTKVGRVGSGAGFNAFALRTSDAPWFGSGLEIRKTGRQYPLSVTQHHQNMAGRDLVRVGTVEEFVKNPRFAHNEIDQPSLYPGYTYDGYKWGMSIDLTACIGCGACVVACQAENNIPVVGKDQVARGREMHWLRIDRYYQGDREEPDTYFEPVPCMQCENAPCELVCPVGATTHTDDGLNAMIYNRCVGTRYCSNNCPYKVRRFNFLQFSDVKTPSRRLQYNPNVTVRNRGVMEKCTYCVQRIQTAKITAELHDRPVRDGEIVPACAQACPTQAIVFGDINDEASRVRALKEQPHNYGLLVELNTRPRTTYLARIRNPNPELEKAG
ncbi:MAG TPA: TAT-variant-translocated molybdopterin oxidoreductase [Verrucomicrobiae bacterium]|nr:TAT-variant-translocated molybdopterin oxidoreductase [Verrucomicrobiae bacterium]